MKGMKALLRQYMQGNCSSEEVQLLTSYFGFNDNEKEFERVVMLSLRSPDKKTQPLVERVYDHLQSSEWRQKIKMPAEADKKKRVSQGYLAAGFLILLFIVLMFFLFRDKIQYDKTWKTVGAPPTVENTGE